MTDKKQQPEDYSNEEGTHPELSDVVLNYVRPSDESFEAALKDVQTFVSTCQDICDEFGATPSGLTRDFWRRR